MANRVPTTTSHQGASGGKARASSQAVTVALPSLRNIASGFFCRWSIAASASSAVRVAMPIWARIAGPINQA